MGKLEIGGKGALLALAVSLITAGSKLVETDLYAGVALLVVGIALIIIWAFLIDKQAREAGEKATEKAFGKFKAELERKKYE